MKKLLLCTALVITALQTKQLTVSTIKTPPTQSPKNIEVGIKELSQKTCALCVAEQQEERLVSCKTNCVCKEILCSFGSRDTGKSIFYKQTYCLEQEAGLDKTQSMAVTFRGNIIDGPYISKQEYALVQKASRKQQAEIMRINYALERWQP